MTTSAPSTTTNYITFDENTSAGGFVLVAPADTSMTVAVSSSATTAETPSSVTANLAYATTYNVYIDVTPSKNALYGAIF